jgi:hypothetical protein
MMHVAYHSVIPDPGIFAVPQACITGKRACENQPSSVEGSPPPPPHKQISYDDDEEEEEHGHNGAARQFSTTEQTLTIAVSPRRNKRAMSKRLRARLAEEPTDFMDDIGEWRRAA